MCRGVAGGDRGGPFGGGFGCVAIGTARILVDRGYFYNPLVAECEQVTADGPTAAQHCRVRKPMKSLKLKLEGADGEGRSVPGFRQTRRGAGLSAQNAEIFAARPAPRHVRLT